MVAYVTRTQWWDNYLYFYKHDNVLPLMSYLCGMKTFRTSCVTYIYIDALMYENCINPTVALLSSYQLSYPRPTALYKYGRKDWECKMPKPVFESLHPCQKCEHRHWDTEHVLIWSRSSLSSKLASIQGILVRRPIQGTLVPVLNWTSVESSASKIGNSPLRPRLYTLGLFQTHIFWVPWALSNTYLWLKEPHQKKWNLYTQ